MYVPRCVAGNVRVFKFAVAVSPLSAACAKALCVTQPNVSTAIMVKIMFIRTPKAEGALVGSNRKSTLKHLPTLSYLCICHLNASQHGCNTGGRGIFASVGAPLDLGQARCATQKLSQSNFVNFFSGRRTTECEYWVPTGYPLRQSGADNGWIEAGSLCRDLCRNPAIPSRVGGC